MNLSEAHFLTFKIKSKFLLKYSTHRCNGNMYKSFKFIQPLTYFVPFFFKDYIFWDREKIYFLDIDWLIFYSDTPQFSTESMIGEWGSIREYSHSFGVYPLPRSDGKKFIPGHSVTPWLFVLSSSRPDWVRLWNILEPIPTMFSDIITFNDQSSFYFLFFF